MIGLLGLVLSFAAAVESMGECEGKGKEKAILSLPGIHLAAVAADTFSVFHCHRHIVATYPNHPKVKGTTKCKHSTESRGSLGHDFSSVPFLHVKYRKNNHSYFLQSPSIYNSHPHKQTHSSKFLLRTAQWAFSA